MGAEIGICWGRGRIFRAGDVLLPLGRAARDGDGARGRLRVCHRLRQPGEALAMHLEIRRLVGGPSGLRLAIVPGLARLAIEVRRRIVAALLHRLLP